MNIQAVARRTGIPSATLRKWEQRYGVLTPERTAGSHRRYTERDVLRVEWLKARIEEGYRIGEAARLLGGYSDAPRLDAEGLVEELVAGAVSPDPPRVVSAVDQAFALFPTEHAVTEVIAPALRRIGELWEQGEATVAQEHQLTGIPERIQTTAGVGHDQNPGSQGMHDPHGERHLAKAVAFVTVKSPLQGHDRSPAQASDEKSSRVTLDGG